MSEELRDKFALAITQSVVSGIIQNQWTVDQIKQQMPQLAQLVYAGADALIAVRQAKR